MVWSRPISFAQRARLTHFVRIPIVIGQSYSPVKEVYCRLRRDPVLRKLPDGAFVDLENLHLSVGALSLGTPQRINAAAHLLRNFSKDEWRQPYTAPGTDKRPTGPTCTASSHRPLSVNLIGVGDVAAHRTERDESRLIRLHTSVQDPNEALAEFFQQLKSVFLNNNLRISFDNDRPWRPIFM